MSHRFVLPRPSLIALLLFLLPSSSSSLNCYNSDTPHLDSDTMKRCPEGEVCFVEFYINNVSGAPVHKYERFCTQAKQCVRHDIPMNHDVEIFQLALASQDAFYTQNANMTKNEGQHYIFSTWFRCCDKDGCNNIDLHSVKQRFNIWPSLHTSSFSPYSFACFAILAVCLLIS